MDWKSTLAFLENSELNRMAKSSKFEKHEGRECNGCGKSPIIGPVFICTIS